MYNGRKRIGLFLPTYSRNYDAVSASIWIRALQMKDYYEKHGIKVHINNPFLKYDYAIYYRLANRKALYTVKWLKKISRKIFFDTCVNYYEKHNHCTTAMVSFAKRISRLCDGIICSTEPIAKQASRYNKNVFVMDDSINILHFKYQKTQINFDNPVFGWSGICSKSSELSSYKEIINGRIILLMDKELSISELGFTYKFMKWRYESFPHDLLSIDVAFLPRGYNDPYNVGHSSFKALVFAIQSIPIVANKLPSYQKLAEFYDGIVFLEDFKNNVFACIDELRGRCRDASKAKVYYGCANQAKRLINFLEGIEQ